MPDPRSQIPDFMMEPWATAVLVMPQHLVWMRWNLAALQKHCMNLSNPLYLAPSENTTGLERKQLSLEERVAGMKPHETEKLEWEVEVAVGMEAMVVINITTKADLANGTCGEVVGLVLDP
jgi:hypothetical protein